ncbi:recombinase family protein [Cryobacterium sp. PH31-AA6]|uniref:recombinase family protein n=1 Tax=Cryobacterium sp. PH31-AA6 TaxID=3046205 RepID=UPI0024B8BC07|nr:recombinase family protein [Cryobacterium sp. PH31-AA6]MDJ0323209.1 recombinase family protein [Cryobacterium sp. PH31-AA6]
MRAFFDGRLDTQITSTPRAAMDKACIYIRQSTAREESISSALQEHEGRRYASAHGYEVLSVVEDIGISGRTFKRPGITKVMAAIEAGEIDVVIVWKWSRISRSRLDWAVAADRVQTAGGRIESATEPLDTTTSTGRLARGMMTEFAAFESERIGDGWKETHARRIRNGLPANGKPRFGYEYAKGAGFTVDAVSGPVLRQAFTRYLGGQSMYSLVQWLNAGGTRPVGGYGVKGDGLWSDRTLRRVMDSGFAAGFISSGGELSPGAHEAILTPPEWDAYREARGRRSTYGRIERSEYLLSGMVWCACGSKMTAGQFGAGKVAKYRCKDAHSKRTHSGGYATASLVEAAVFAWLVEREAELRDAAAAALKTGPKRAVANPGAQLARKITALDARMDALTARLIDSGIPKESYTRLRDAMEAERKTLEAELLASSVRASHAPLVVLPEVIAQWDRLLVPERREILRSLIERVSVTPGRPRASVAITGRD